MWQKCPICNGTGNNNTIEKYNCTSVCKTCNGKGIINQLTGLPPKEVETHSLSKDSGDFRDNCSQFKDK